MPYRFRPTKSIASTIAVVISAGLFYSAIGVQSAAAQKQDIGSGENAVTKKKTGIPWIPKKAKVLLIDLSERNKARNKGNSSIEDAASIEKRREQLAKQASALESITIQRIVEMDVIIVEGNSRSDFETVRELIDRYAQTHDDIPSSEDLQEFVGERLRELRKTGDSADANDVDMELSKVWQFVMDAPRELAEIDGDLQALARVEIVMDPENNSPIVRGEKAEDTQRVMTTLLRLRKMLAGESRSHLDSAPKMEKLLLAERSARLKIKDSLR